MRSLAGRGQVVAIDLLAMAPLPGVVFLEGDFTGANGPSQAQGAPARRGRRRRLVRHGRAQGTGHSCTDHLRIMALAEAAAEFAVEVLAPGGALVCKMFQGGSERALLSIGSKAFASVRHVKPPASRTESAELYVTATQFRA